MTRTFRRENILLCTGLLLVSVGGLLNFYWQDILDAQVSKNFVITNSSRTYHEWVKARVPLYLKFYMFNWTNPNSLKDPTIKPHFEELGPYMFWETIEKVNIVWNDNGTISYRRQRKWHFNPEGSNGSLSDKITSLNVVALSATHLTRKWARLSKLPLSLAIAGSQEMFVTKTVGEYLFEGFTNPLIDTASKVPGMSHMVPFDRFGWFYKRNGSSTADGLFNIETGENGMEDFGRVRSWNYNTHTPFYEGQCGEVRGSAGDFWPPKQTKDKEVTLFSADVCRYLTFDYEKEEMIHDVTGYKYVAGPRLVDNGTLDPRNECFCGGECVASGLVNVSSCRFGAPAFISYPHFYLADPVYNDSVVGMIPDPAKHMSYMILEPYLGIPLEVAARFQVNMLVQPHPGVSLFEDVQRLFFPVMWFEQRVTLPEETLNLIKVLLVLPMAGTITALVLLAVGVCLLLGYVLYRFHYRNRKTLVITKQGYTEKCINISTNIDTEANSPLMKHKNNIEITTNSVKSVKDTHL